MNELTTEQRKARGDKARPSRAKVSQNKASRPVMPTFLTPAARKEWRRIIPLLEQRGTLTNADSMGLAVYCEAVARWQDAQKQIAKDGITVTVTVLDKHGAQVTSTKPNVALKVAENCERTIRQYLREYGLTGLTRERVKPTKPREFEEDEEDGPDLLELMRREREGR